ncbi:MAG: hydrogenase formation protein HypD [Thermodesulfobacteriota bacterium]|nr:hydrogenase formation protein HypD [Thermodesulfobacteriota bacterium]
MKHIDEYRDPHLSRKIADQVQALGGKDIRLMEVCGTHTVAIFRNGIRSLLPESLALLSGPGCPVCVTPQQEIDAFIKAADLEDVIVATFGDLLRVPGSLSSLERERAEGREVRVVYSAFDALDLAEQNPQKEIVFLGVGFETTAPTIAASIMEGKRRGLENFSVCSAHKLVPPALHALMSADEARIDGFICPGHVSVIIGTKAYLPVVERHHIPCVIGGFEPADILRAIYMLIQQIDRGDAKAENSYSRAVTFEGNEKARMVMYTVFEPRDAVWRGIGTIPQSGLKIRGEFEAFDAEKRFNLQVPDSKEPKGCACGEILMGLKTPPECPLYKRACTPSHPVGPCMVSTEGTCAAYFKYHA